MLKKKKISESTAGCKWISEPSHAFFLSAFCPGLKILEIKYVLTGLKREVVLQIICIKLIQ